VGHVTLAVLCAATSLFTDLGTGQSTEHALRTCLIAMRLTAGLGFGTEACREVLYVSLLRLLGYTADAHQAAGLAGGDEIGFLAGMAPVKAMGSPHEEIARLIGLVAAEEAMPRRLRLGAGGEIKGNGSTGHGNCYLAPGAGRGRGRGGPDRHLPRRPLPTPAPPTRQKQSHRRGRPLTTGDHLASARRPRHPVPRPWR
jgi:hypothetical protein